MILYENNSKRRKHWYIKGQQIFPVFFFMKLDVFI
jgi:hypothetical protein